MYLPFFYVLGLAVLLLLKDAKAKKHLIIYLLAVLASFLISNYFYYHNLFVLFYLIYKSDVIDVLGKNWKVVAALSGLISAMPLLYALVVRKSDRLVKTIQKVSTWIPVFLFVVLLIFMLRNAYDAYLLGYTARYGNFVRAGWDVMGFGFRSVRNLPLFEIILYLSPLGFLAYFFSLFYYRKKTKAGIYLLILFTSIFWVYNIAFRKFTLYHYYIARYSLSELVPYSLLLASLLAYDFWEKKKGRVLLIAALACVFAYFFIFSAFQVGKWEEPDISFFNKPIMVPYVGTPTAKFAVPSIGSTTHV